jgi:hypothetical protein
MWEIAQNVMAAVGAAAIIGFVGWVARLGQKQASVENRVTTLEATDVERKKTLDAAVSGQGDHSIRLTVIESVLDGLRQIPGALEKIMMLATKLDTVLDNQKEWLEKQDRRIEMLEERERNG